MTTLPFVDIHNLVAFLDSPAKSEGFEQIIDFMNASSIRYALTVNPTIYTLCIQQFWATVKVKTINGEVQLQALVDGNKIIITESTIRRDLQLEDDEGVDCLPNATIFEQLTLIGDNVVEEAINEENVPTHSNDPLISGEDRLKLEELMALCTNLQNRVLDLEHTKTTQVLEIDSLKRRVKKLEKKQRTKTHRLKRLYKVGISARVISSKDEGLGEEDASKQGRKIYDIDAEEDITLDSTHFDTDHDMFGVHDLDGDEVFVTKESMDNAATIASTIPVSAAKDLFDVDMTLAQALAELKNAKPKAVTTAATITTTAVPRPKPKGLVIQEQEQASTPITSLKDKGKGIMVEEPLKMTKKDQVLFDEQEAIRLQAQFDEEERIAREKEEANVALIAQCNDIQDKVETDYDLAQRAQRV
ncbi:hypothetical protein Tco_0936216 [Tanacetum coccineum]